MTDYLVMIAEREAATPAAAAQRLEQHASYRQRIADSVLDAGWLRPRAEGKRVQRDRVEDGSFDDAFDRYYWIRANDLDQALSLTSQLPFDDGERVDVRPLIEGTPGSDKLDRPGKVFLLSVLGVAHDEPAWTELMETIAEETRNTLFSLDQFAGGLRLRPPSTGRRIVLDKSKRRVVDGPFLESKEVIGGVFFVRMATMEDAVRWAAASPFLAHGALEIRELWRT